MSLDVITRITQVEQESRERKTAAEANARQMIADAKQESAALLRQVHDAAAEEGKSMLKAAELRAEKRTAEIHREAENAADVLRRTAEQHLGEAADLIVGRVVKQ